MKKLFHVHFRATLKNIEELDSTVLDAIKEELSQFNNYLLKYLSFSNALSISSLAFCTVLFIVAI